MTQTMSLVIKVAAAAAAAALGFLVKADVFHDWNSVLSTLAGVIAGGAWIPQPKAKG